MIIVQVGTGSLRIPPDRYGAAESYIYNLSKGLAAEGHAITILDIQESAGEAHSEELNGIKRLRIYGKHFQTASGNPWLDYVRELLDLLGFSLKVNSHLRKQGYDIIHLHRMISSPLLVFLNRRLRPKMIYTAHSSIWMEDKPGRLHKLALALDAYTMRRVARVIAQAETLKAKFIRIARIPPEKIAVIPSAVDTAHYRPDNMDGTEVKHKYDMKGRTTILCVGHIIPRKGVEYLVKAAAQLVDEPGYQEALFLLVGPLAQPGFDKLSNRSYTASIMELIKQKGLERSVRLTGTVSQSDLLELFRACDIFVLPSLAESSPAVMLQAMSCAKPVIGTRVGGIADQIRDGWNGFLVEPADENALAAKIGYLLSYPEERLRMGQNSGQFARSEFGWTQACQKMANAYREVLKT